MRSPPIAVRFHHTCISDNPCSPPVQDIRNARRECRITTIVGQKILSRPVSLFGVGYVERVNNRGDGSDRSHQNFYPLSRLYMIEQRESYALEAGGPFRLEISWGFFSRTVVIYLDRQEIGRIKRSKITRPHEFILNDGSRLIIQLVPSFKILGIGFQPYLHLSLNGLPLPGLTPSPEQSLLTAKSWIVALAFIKLLQGILAPDKKFVWPSALQWKEILEWQQNFYSSLAIALILLGLWALPKRFTKRMLTVALTLIFADFFLEVICIMVCQTNRTHFMAAAQGLAFISLYQALSHLNKK